MIDALPVKLAVADRNVAMVMLSLDQPFAGTIVIRSPSVVAALMALFEVLWERAQPLNAPAVAAEGDRFEPVEREILALMAAGLKDETIARQLNIGLRTLARRISGLMAKLGATTRFEAGMLAAQLGVVGARARTTARS